MRNSAFLWVLVGIMLVLDIYVFQIIRSVLNGSSPRLRITVFSIYWFFSIIFLATLALLPFINFDALPKSFRTYLFAIVVALFFSKLIACIFFAIDDLRRGSMWVIGKLFSNPSIEVKPGSDGITRSVFLNWLGLGIGGTFLGTMMYGFTNKYNYKVKKEKIIADNLPSAFRGLKIVHISDIHAGSFMDQDSVAAGVELIRKQNPDLVVFTGDLVNDHAQEMDNYIEVFKQISAPMGVFSTLGNHDYGEYALPRGLTAEERAGQVRKNVFQMEEVHRKLGWRLLMNENVSLEKDGVRISIIGVENWSMKGNFPKYGRLDQAYRGAEDSPFKILLSHDPSHWEGEVKQKFPAIDLMLSGHTHGMQFGVEIPGFRWSPVQYMYKQWAGLYTDKNQQLYVNRGFGFIGYPGRVGILPEITVIELA